MLTAQEIYAEELENQGAWFGTGDYQPMLDSFGTILAQEDEANYQGDSLVLYQSESRFGILSFGWGSCSGCDALQACDSIEEVEELRLELFNSIKWFDSLDEALVYLNEHDWEGDFIDQDLRTDFVSKATKALNAIKTTETLALKQQNQNQKENS